MEFRNHHKTTSPVLVLLLLLLLVLLQAISSPAMAANIYRYVDNQGRMVWDSKIPSQYVKNGYSILNERGQVIQVVPRALTPEEIAQQSQALEAQKQAEAAERAQLEADSLLLRLFRSPEDIERKRDEKLEQLDVQRTVLSAARNKTQEEVTRLEGILTRSEQANLDPSPDTIESLKFQTAEIERLQGLLTNLDVEAEQAVADAARDIGRLKELLNLP